MGAAACGSFLDSGGCSVGGLCGCGDDCPFECALEQVVVRRKKGATPSLTSQLGDWLAGSKLSVLVKVDATIRGKEVASLRTGPGKSLSRGASGQGLSDDLEVWGWEDSSSYGPLTSLPLEFSLPGFAQLRLRVVQTGGGGPELLGEAYLRLNEDVMSLAEAFVPRPEQGAGAHLTLPLLLDGRSLGSVSLIARLAQEKGSRLRTTNCVHAADAFPAWSAAWDRSSVEGLPTLPAVLRQQG